ncbi:hypothetical protein OPV22_001510 [Ensete ventricosum]|uniref:Ribosomal protein L18e/L15P domain-containing protein n=1 Tax=Ensete ventricosum TaxID=4639 RepID=A0AAV8RSE5_ENSVE|nr:hypothetical protein OPV22_001510 [Ensete ventricosum]
MLRDKVKGVAVRKTIETPEEVKRLPSTGMLSPGRSEACKTSGLIRHQPFCRMAKLSQVLLLWVTATRFVTNKCSSTKKNLHTVPATACSVALAQLCFSQLNSAMAFEVCGCVPVGRPNRPASFPPTPPGVDGRHSLSRFVLLSSILRLRFWTTPHQVIATTEMIIPTVRRPRILDFLKPYVLKMHITDKYVSAQVIHTPTAEVAVSASSHERLLRPSIGSTRDVAAAAKIGKLLGERLLLRGIPAVCVFLKKEQKYHGKVKAVIDSVRDAGVKLL